MTSWKENNFWEIQNCMINQRNGQLNVSSEFVAENHQKKSRTEEARIKRMTWSYLKRDNIWISQTMDICSSIPYEKDFIGEGHCSNSWNKWNNQAGRQARVLTMKITTRNKFYNTFQFAYYILNHSHEKGLSKRDSKVHLPPSSKFQISKERFTFWKKDVKGRLQ